MVISIVFSIWNIVSTIKKAAISETIINACGDAPYFLTTVVLFAIIAGVAPKAIPTQMGSSVID